MYSVIASYIALIDSNMLMLIIILIFSSVKETFMLFEEIGTSKFLFLRTNICSADILPPVSVLWGTAKYILLLISLFWGQDKQTL